jgi:hypothetical protein
MHCAVFIPAKNRFETYEDLFSIMKTEFMSQYKWVDCSQLKAFCLALRRNVWAWIADMQPGADGNDEPVFRLFRPGNMPNAPPLCFSYPGASVESTIHLFYHKMGEAIVSRTVPNCIAKYDRNASVPVEDPLFEWKYGSQSIKLQGDRNHFEALYTAIKFS